MIEAVRALINYVKEEEMFIRLEAFIAPDNIPSINLISKLGFEKEAVLRSHHHFKGQTYDSVVYAHFPLT